MNVVCLTGRVTKDIEIKQSGETTIATFSIAVTRDFKDKETGKYETYFFDCTAFGSVAKFLEKYVTKGMKIEVSGRLRQDRWKDKDDNNRSRVVVVANNVGFAEPKASSGQSDSQAASSSAPASKPSADGFVEVPDGIEEELPFM